MAMPASAVGDDMVRGAAAALLLLLLLGAAADAASWSSASNMEPALEKWYARPISASAWRLMSACRRKCLAMCSRTTASVSDIWPSARSVMASCAGDSSGARAAQSSWTSRRGKANESAGVPTPRSPIAESVAAKVALSR